MNPQNFFIAGTKIDLENVTKKALNNLSENNGFISLENAIVPNPHVLQMEIATLIENQYLADFKRAPRDLYANRDSITGLTSTMQVVAPSPDVNPALINTSLTTFYVNKAIELHVPPIEPARAIWLVIDRLAEKTEWFTNNINAFRHIACFEKSFLGYTYDTPYTFELMPMMKSPDTLYEGICYNGATTSGVALQLAFWLGAKTILLNGVSMRTNEYFDGSLLHEKGERQWDDFRRHFEKIASLIQRAGTRIKSQTYTSIKIPSG